MFRRLVLAVLTAACTTLSGVSGCGSDKLADYRCGPKGDSCYYPAGCCSPYRCVANICV